MTLVIWLFAPNLKVSAQGQPPLVFLGPIYYGTDTVNAVFDHYLPLLSVGGGDGNTCTQHYDGTACNNNPPPGYGYDEHDGIDYGLSYEPVLAAASGTVHQAGWSNAADHRYGLGLLVRIDHDNDYRTEYGHLSTVVVQAGDPIVVDPDNWEGIIGISGNTGNVEGNNCDPDDDPTCGAHLHFGLVNPDGIRVNPYGWIGEAGTDPWELNVNGAPSYDVWDGYPSITTDQFDSDDPIDRPPMNEARLIIDDSSADFTTSSFCWDHAAYGNSYNGAYTFSQVNLLWPCTATWRIQPDAFSPPGAYDVYVYVPDVPNTSLGAEYTVKHNGETSTAIVVQAAYGDNSMHDAWAYIGRYDFAMSNNVEEFVRLNDNTFDGDGENRVLADAIKLLPADPTPPPVEMIYVSFASDGVAGNVPYADEDILGYDTNSGDWCLLFDGSDVHLADTDVDAIHMADGDILFSVDVPVKGIDDADVVVFTPTSLGENTVGLTSILYSSANLFLTDESEDIDALAATPNDVLTLSTIGNATETGSLIFADEDLFNYYPNFLTHLRFYFDGSDELLSDESEDVNGAWIDPATGDVYLTTNGLFSVSGSSGDGADIFVCDPLGLGSVTDCAFGPGLFWNGSAHGMGAATVDGIYVGNPPSACSHFTNGSFELQFACWTVETNYPGEVDWQPTAIDAYLGQYSARGQALLNYMPDWAWLISSPINVTSNTRYRFGVYGKGVPGTGFNTAIAEVHWYDVNGQIVGSVIGVGAWSSNNPITWTGYSVVACSPANAVKARFKVRVNYPTLSQQPDNNTIPSESDTGYVLVDNVTWQAESGTCPLLNQ